MGYFKVISELLLVGLKLWDRADKRKFFRELRKLEEQRFHEEAKSIKDRDQALLDRIDFKLQRLSQEFIAEANRPNTSDKS